MVPPAVAVEARLVVDAIGKGAEGAEGAEKAAISRAAAMAKGPQGTELRKLEMLL